MQPAAKYTREQLIADAWRCGDLRYKFKPIQSRLYSAYHTCKTFLFVSLIARQTGKSFHWAIVAIETCLKKPRARIRYGTAFQSDLEEFIRPIFETICEDAPDDVRPKYKAQGAKFTFQNGSEIKLVGLDLHPNGLRGNALDLVIIDEAGFVSKLRYIFSSIILPMLRNRPHLRVVMSSTPPETPDHEFTEFVHEARETSNLFIATIDDDEKTTEATKEALAKECGGRDSTTYRREFMVEFVTDSDLAIIPEWKEEYEVEMPQDEMRKYFHNYLALDLGVVDFTAGLFGYYHFRAAKLVIEDELIMHGPAMTTDKLAVAIKEKEHALWGAGSEDWNEKRVYRRVADNNNLLLLSDLGSLHGMYVRATDKDELEAMVNEVRLWVKANRVAVHPRCKQLIGCLRYGIFNHKKVQREFARSKVYGHYDALAALTYLIRNIDPHTNPIPANLGTSPFTHHMRDVSHETETQKVMGKIIGKRFVTGRAVARKHN